MVKLPNHVLLSRRVHYSCCHTPPHTGPVGTSASTAYIRPSCTPQMQPNMAPQQTVEDIPPGLPDEDRVFLLNHTEDSVQRLYLGNVEQNSYPGFDLAVTHPQEHNARWLREFRCPCGVPRCKGKHAEILEPHQIAYKHLWASLPEHAYEGIVKHLDQKALLAFRLACRE